MTTWMFLVVSVIQSPLQDAHREYELFNFDEAIRLSTAAIATASELHEKIEALALRAEIYLALENTEAAIADYVQIILLNPTFEGPKYPAPKVAKALRTARNRVDKTATPTPTGTPTATPESDTVKGPTESPPPYLATPGTEVTRPIYRRWWFWSGLVAVVSVGAVGIYLGIRGSDPNFSSGHYGPFPLGPS